MQHPDFREKLGKLVALRLVHRLADSGDMALIRILEMLSGMHSA